MFDQVAVVSRDINKSIAQAKAAGLDEWTRDTVLAKALVRNRPTEFRARLAFNYDIVKGIEFEYIEPITLPNYARGKQPGEIAHMGIHVADEDEKARWVTDLMLEGIHQECWTIGHGNPAVPDDRSYHYTIFDTALFPFPVKIIERITREQAMAVELG